MQRYRVKVPAGVMAGSPFHVNVAGQKMRVVCPAGVQAGMDIEIQVPRAPPPQQPSQHPQHPQQQSRTAPPAPAPGGALTGLALKPQSAASRAAEAALQACHGAPDPGTIFSAMDRDDSNAVDVEELQFGLSHGGRHDFSLTTCKLLVRLYDGNRDGTVSRQEFLGLWRYLDQWRATFDAHDKGKNGSIERGELQAAIQAVGYKFSDSFYSKLLRIYDAGGRGSLSFDHFVRLFCELHNLTEAFKAKDTDRTGTAEFSYEAFLDAAYSIHI